MPKCSLGKEKHKNWKTQWQRSERCEKGNTGKRYTVIIFVVVYKKCSSSNLNFKYVIFFFFCQNITWIFVCFHFFVSFYFNVFLCSFCQFTRLFFSFLYDVLVPIPLPYPKGNFRSKFYLFNLHFIRTGNKFSAPQFSLFLQFVKLLILKLK